jgi:hypothetical protein
MASSALRRDHGCTGHDDVGIGYDGPSHDRATATASATAEQPRRLNDDIGHNGGGGGMTVRPRPHRQRRCSHDGATAMEQP